MGSKKRPDANQQRYSKMVTAAAPRPPRLRNALWAFASGGVVCVLGQLLTDGFGKWLRLPPEKAANPAAAVMVLLGALLTGLGYFDKLARYAGAGLAVPITGFANAMAASALEFKREGLVYGVGSKMFALAGAVIVFGVVTAFAVGIVYATVLGVRR